MNEIDNFNKYIAQLLTYKEKGINNFDYDDFDEFEELLVDLKDAYYFIKLKKVLLDRYAIFKDFVDSCNVPLDNVEVLVKTPNTDCWCDIDLSDEVEYYLFASTESNFKLTEDIKRFYNEVKEQVGKRFYMLLFSDDKIIEIRKRINDFTVTEFTLYFRYFDYCINYPINKSEKLNCYIKRLINEGEV